MTILHPPAARTARGSRQERGQGMVEYALILGLIALVVIAVVAVVGSNTKSALCSVGQGLGGSGASCRTLYVANRGGTSPFSITEYTVGTNGTATLVNTLTVVDQPEGIAVDANGVLYVANVFAASITEYAPGASGSTLPIRTIKGSASTTLSQPAFLAFDASGTLYVSNYTTNTVIEFAPSVSGDVAPSRTILGIGMNGIRGLALDSGGSIYLAYQSSGIVYKFPPGSGAPGGGVTGSASRIISGVNQAYGLAVDNAGIIYTGTSLGSGPVGVYGPGATATPTSTVPSNSPFGLGLDAANNLYVASEGDGTVAVFAAGTSTRTSLITGLNHPLGIAVH